MRDEKITFTIAQKLRFLAFVETNAEMFFDGCFGRQQPVNYQVDCFTCGSNTNCFAHPLVDCARGSSTIDRGRTALNSLNFRDDLVAFTLIQELLNNK